MPRTQMIQAQKLHKGHQIISRPGTEPMRVIAMMSCPDGSIRITTTRDEQRMSAAFMVRVVH